MERGREGGREEEMVTLTVGGRLEGEEKGIRVGGMGKQKDRVKSVLGIK